MPAATTNSPEPLSIAIVGAGLVGATAALALSRLPNVTINVYERSPEPREVGAWIAMNVSGRAFIPGLRVLGNILPDYSQLRDIMYQGETGINHRHWRTGEALGTSESPHTAPKYREGRTHRIPLHELLLSHVEPGTIHYDKHVIRADFQAKSGRGGAILTFTDGDVVHVDLVVAADGIYSKLRRQYLPQSIPAYRGVVAYRKIFPESLLSHIKGLPEGTSSWQKEHGEVMYMSKVGLGKYGIVAIVREADDAAKPLSWGQDQGEGGIARLQRHFKDWDPIIIEVVSALPNIDAYRLEGAAWMDNMTRDDSIAFVGDAAHPTAGAYGAGATFGFGDVWALYRSLLAFHHNTYDVAAALDLFNRTRRPFLARVERQMSFDRKNGAYIASALDEESWIARWRERFSPNWWMLEHDVEAEWQKVYSEVLYEQN
ncbi:salicylate hydroxylase [Plectosphaerella plurivora]|uniref:Salicylate hydroxylase n=1 Tax=Plectosphaerella plurivora TaxID=936078 RepID=A0A9P8V551_9PEZI|nr:salicylate hydroxylase [Plectosphaerella plurivora]